MIQNEYPWVLLIWPANLKTSNEVSQSVNKLPKPCGISISLYQIITSSVQLTVMPVN